MRKYTSVPYIGGIICQMMLSPNAGEAGHSQVVEYSRLKWFAFP